MYRILSSPLYVGEIPHGRKRYPGQHPAIVERKLYDQVQAVLAANRRKTIDGSKAGPPALLAGLVSTKDGTRLVSTHTSKGRQVYRYYATPVATPEADRMRVPAVALEKLVVDSIVAKLGQAEAVAPDLLGCSDLPAFIASAAMLATNLRRADPKARRELMLKLVSDVAVSDQAVTVEIRAGAIDAEMAGASIMVSTTATVGRRKTSLALVIDNRPNREPDPQLLALVARARSWFEDLRSGEVPSIAALAKREAIAPVQVKRTLPFAFMAPELVTSIADGTQPADLTVAALRHDMTVH